MKRETTLNDSITSKQQSHDRIVQIVPSLVPNACGVGDYAVRVATGLLAQGLRSDFIVCGTEMVDRSADNDPRGPFPTVTFRSDLKNQLTGYLRTHEVLTIIVHYTGYGYDPSGSPRWLADVLSEHERRTGARIFTFFHETWQAPALFSRRLYRTLFQRRVVQKMCKLSHGIITNTRQRVAKLSRYHERCEYLPVFSNVGEQTGISSKNSGTAVIFGLPQRRQRTWNALSENCHLLTVLGVSAVIDIGADPVIIPESLYGFATVKGSLEAMEVSAILTKASTAFIFYNNSELGKSGILAAFAAHRLCVVNLDEAKKDTVRADVTPGVHFLLASHLYAGTYATDQAAVADALADWYRPHCFDENIKKFVHLLAPAGFVSSDQSSLNGKPRL